MFYDIMFDIENSNVLISNINYSENPKNFNSLNHKIISLKENAAAINEIKMSEADTLLSLPIGESLISFLNLDLLELRNKYLSQLLEDKKHILKYINIEYVKKIWLQIIETHIYFLIDNNFAHQFFDIDFNHDVPLWRMFDEYPIKIYTTRQAYDFMEESINEFFNKFLRLQNDFTMLIDSCMKTNEGINNSAIERLFESNEKSSLFWSLGLGQSSFYYVPFRTKSSNATLLEACRIEYASTWCYLEFINMVKKNIQVKECGICKNYFIPEGRIDTLYCESCQKAGGAMLAYKEKVAQNDFLKLFNREYQRRYARLRIYGKELRKIKLKELNDGWVTNAKLKMAEEGLTIVQFEKWIEEGRSE